MHPRIPSIPLTINIQVTSITEILKYYKKGVLQFISSHTPIYLLNVFRCKESTIENIV